MVVGLVVQHGCVFLSCLFPEIIKAHLVLLGSSNCCFFLFFPEDFKTPQRMFLLSGYFYYHLTPTLLSHQNTP